MGSDWIIGAACGGMGGAVGQLITNPVDVVKIQLQLHKGGFFEDARTRPRGWMVLRDIIKSNGTQGLWRGGAVACCHQFLYSSCRLQTYEVLKEYLGSADPNFSERTLWAALSGVLATILSNPLERCKVVIQAVPREQCPSLGRLLRGFSKYSVDNLKCLYKGGERTSPQGLMGGVWPSVQRSALVHAVQLSVYDEIREYGEAQLSLDPLASIVFASTTAGFASAGVGAPLDIIKTRLMVQQNLHGSGIYKGIVDCFVRIAREEGTGSLFKGYLATWLKIGPFTVAQFLTWDYLRQMCYEGID